MQLCAALGVSPPLPPEIKGLSQQSGESCPWHGCCEIRSLYLCQMPHNGLPQQITVQAQRSDTKTCVTQNPGFQECEGTGRDCDRDQVHCRGGTGQHWVCRLREHPPTDNATINALWANKENWILHIFVSENRNYNDTQLYYLICFGYICGNKAQGWICFPWSLPCTWESHSFLIYISCWSQLNVKTFLLQRSHSSSVLLKPPLCMTAVTSKQAYRFMAIMPG